MEFEKRTVIRRVWYFRVIAAYLDLGVFLGLELLSERRRTACL
jgi:hypothetical protein